MIHIGVTKFVRDMERIVKRGELWKQRILVTKKDRFYFVVLSYQLLNEEYKVRVAKVLGTLKKKKSTNKAKLTRRRILREIERKKRELQ